MTAALFVAFGVALGWFVAGFLWSLVATLVTGVFQDPRNFWFVWRWKSQP